MITTTTVVIVTTAIDRLRNRESPDDDPAADRVRGGGGGGGGEEGREEGGRGRGRTSKLKWADVCPHQIAMNACELYTGWAGSKLRTEETSKNDTMLMLQRLCCPFTSV